MASTVTAATLTVTISESITLNGVSRDSSSTASITRIRDISNRIIEVTNATNGTQLLKVAANAAAVGAGTYDKTAVKYVRITNLDDTNYIILQFTDEGTHHWEVKLDAGKSYVIGDTSSVDDQADIDNYSASALTLIAAKADTASCDVELYIAAT